MSKHYATIGEYLVDVGKSPPEHPLFTVVSVNTDMLDTSENCPDLQRRTTTEFYSISLKNIVEGEVLYGKTHYDCTNGTMLFMAPNQEFGAQGVKIKSTGHIILMHPDYFAGHSLGKAIKNYDFFDYSVSEALHLSPREEGVIAGLFESIRRESQSGYDQHSRDILLSHISTLLGYAERFYRRQFVQRNEVGESLYAALVSQLDRHYLKDEYTTLPVLSDIAEKMNVSSRYLSDAVKTETGKSAKECMQLFIIDKAKELLVTTNEPVSSIAYSLGYDYPQYFVRLFKKKTKKTPTEFRESFH